VLATADGPDDILAVGAHELDDQVTDDGRYLEGTSPALESYGPHAQAGWWVVGYSRTAGVVLPHLGCASRLAANASIASSQHIQVALNETARRGIDREDSTLNQHIA